MTSFQIKKEFRAAGKVFRLDVGHSWADGTVLGVSGPSGSGKSTLLRCLAGLEKSEGFVESRGTVWSKAGTFVPPQRRPVGFVFQDYALFPHLTVLGNLLYVRDDRAQAMEYLELVRMTEHARHFPAELSGGQKQRTALARALMRRPELLLDEPLSALDEDLRESLGHEIRRIQRETGVTTVVVSHSSREIALLADEVITL